MPWQAWVGLYIISGSLVAKILIKRFSASPARIQWLVGQYAFCALFSFLYLGFAGTKIEWPLLALFIALGMVSSLSTYAQWRAIDMSMSVTSLCTPAGGLIALLLGYLFLGEARYVNSGVAAGLVITLIAVGIFTGTRIAPRHERIHPGRLIKYIAMMSIMAGVVIFLMRLFAQHGIPLPLYVTGWYTGTFIGSLLLYFLKGRNKERISLSLKDLGLLAILGVSIWTAKTFLYVTLSQAPITVVEPIFQVSEIIIPSLIGLYVFHEITLFNLLQRFSFVLGVIGSVLLAISY